ncbi:MAG: HRDC domain-containing protein [Actinomycetota bacterium]|nr:HRDC domain-containing protein [Actinomycetota bacterium]
MGLPPPASTEARRGGPPAAPADGPLAEAARQGLRSWRSDRARAERKPPYVYLHDATVEAIVADLPGSLAALARVRGIGPAKLEAYGDELLAVLDAARQALAGPPSPTDV